MKLFYLIKTDPTKVFKIFDTIFYNYLLMLSYVNNKIIWIITIEQKYFDNKIQHTA